MRDPEDEVRAVLAGAAQEAVGEGRGGVAAPLSAGCHGPHARLLLHPGSNPGQALPPRAAGLSHMARWLEVARRVPLAPPLPACGERSICERSRCEAKQIG